MSKSTGSIIAKPLDPARERRTRHKNKVDGIKDTSPALATELTYRGEDFAAIRAAFRAEMAAKEERERMLVFNE